MRESKYRSYDNLPLMLSAPEVAEVLGISRAGAYDLVRSAGFPHMKLGNRILVPKDKFIKWIDNNTEGMDELSINTRYQRRITFGYTTKYLI